MAEEEGPRASEYDGNAVLQAQGCNPRAALLLWRLESERRRHAAGVHGRAVSAGVALTTLDHIVLRNAGLESFHA